MEFNKLENTAHGIVPGFGAIFMSNSRTRKECIKRRLFGLPSWLGYFVKQIKAGMILFLFEYEKRLLHGVFQASSDGAMNIVPHAYSSSGKQFPAQVRFSIIWCCNPLSEDQFQNAIKENYFSAKKFNFGLSEEQVRRLLSQFSLTKFNDQLHLRQFSRDSLECSSDFFIGEGQSIAEDDRFILNGRVQGKQKMGEDQVNTMQESVPLPHYNLGNILPSPENLIHYSHMDKRNLTSNSALKSNAQITMSRLYRQSDYSTSMPFQATVYSEDITKPCETQRQINLSCSEPKLHSLPTQQFENDGGLRLIDASPYPSHELNYSHHQDFPYQDKQNVARQENTEAYFMYIPVTKEFPSQLPSDSVKLSSVPPYEQTSANHGPKYCGNSGSMLSDHERRDSVFSRLAYPSDASIQEFDDYTDHANYHFDSSIDEVMSGLQQFHRIWEKKNYDLSNQGHKDDRSWITKKKTKSSSSSYSNCFEISDELRMNSEDNIEGNSNQIVIGTPFVNFKRRRKTSKMEDDTPTRGLDVNIECDQLSGGQQKRRRLIRPSFAKNESCDCGGIKNNVSSDLQDSSREIQIFRGRTGSGPFIENNETEKLPQDAELPEIIWLVNNEDKNIGSGSVETQICWGSPSESEDGKESLDYISVSNIASTLSGLDKSCTNKGSTSKDHMVDGYSQNLNNSGLCNLQESSVERSEVNAGYSIIMVDEGANKSNEKELVKSMKISDEPFQGSCGIVMENTIKRTSRLGSASETVLEEFIDGRKQNNEQWRSTNEL